jgi:small-conductance mechanosensitive channel
MNKIIFVLMLNAMSHPIGAMGLVHSVAQEAGIAPVKRSDKRLQALEKERELLKTSLRDTRPQTDKLSVDLDTLKRAIKRSYGKKLEFFNKKLSLLSKEYQVLAEFEQVQQQLMSSLDAQIKATQEYASDENFESLRVPVKAYYDFDDVQHLAQELVSAKAALADAEKNKLAVADDINKRRKSATLLTDEYKEKVKLQESFTAKSKNEREPAQQGELLDAEVRLAELRKNLAELKVTEAERKLSAIEDFMMIAVARLAVLKKEYARVQRSARVSATYVKQVEEELEAKRQQFVAKSDRFNDKMRVILSADMDIKEKIQATQKKFDISASDVATIRLYNKEPKNINEWYTSTLILNLLSEEALLDIEREYLVTQMDIEKAQFRKDEIEVSIVRSWHKMTSDQAGFATDEEVDQEIKMYRLNKAELEAQIVALTNARDAAINSLQGLNTSLDKIKQFVRLLHIQKVTVFKDNQSAYENSAKMLYEVEEKVRRRLNWVAKLIEAYSTIIVAVQNNVKKVDGIIDELRTKSFWRRSDQSIRWSKLQTFFPDLERFARDLRQSTFNLFSHDRLVRAHNFIDGLYKEPLKILLLLINGLMLMIIFFLLWLYLPDVATYFQSAGQGYPFIRYICLMGALVFNFIALYFKSFYGWLLLCILLSSGLLRDPFLAQLFYLLSIPYLLFLTHHFFLYAQKINRQRNFQFMSEEYQERFFWVVSRLSYVIIVIALIREAFLLGGYRNSQVPIVLMAIIFILCQISIIYLLDRKQIMGALRTDTPLWEWVYEHVSQYYYFVWAAVISIIVMSNPYVGYGRQVLYIISRLLVTLALIPLFSWVHNRIKRASVDLFFYYTDSDEIKERFAAGRLWYGLFVISSLFLFLITGLYLGAKIWGSGLTLRDIYGWLDYAIYNQCDDKGNDISVRVSSLLNIVLFILGGIAFAAVVNRFVLRRALDPFLVESGVQNTILTLVRYMIIIIAVFMGLNMAHLEGLTTKLAILIAGVGFAVQEAVRDFFSYFIILVQRPIKIGDLIQVVDASSPTPIIGVVRHITPRSVMVRQRNSVTTIIPNSRIVMSPVLNWSYSRSFIAFDDIMLSIPFGADPAAVRALILKVMDQNPNILKSPAPVVRLQDFVENGYQFLIRGYLTSDKVLDQWDIASEFRLELVKQLRANGIEIASPIRTIRMTTDKNFDVSGFEKR